MKHIEFNDDPFNNFAVLLLIILFSALAAWVVSQMTED
jgi:hypothetical protein